MATKTNTKTKTNSKKKTKFSIVVTGDKSSSAKNENISAKELTELLKVGISSKSKRKALVSFLRQMQEMQDSEIAEMYFGNPIYKTWNYNKFKIIKGNRTIKDAKVEKLSNSIYDGMNLLPYCPVLVDKEYNICDGQHRFETAKSSGLPVYYMVIDKMILEDIAKMNSNSNSWTINDYLNLYVTNGNEHYKYLSKFITDNKIPVGMGIELLTNFNEKKTSVHNDFKAGNFSVEESGKTFANRVISMLSDFEEYGSSFIKKREFLKTLAHLVKKENNKEDYSHTKMMQQMRDIGQQQFCEQVTKEDYLRLLENIYNYRLRSGKIRLY